MIQLALRHDDMTARLRAIWPYAAVVAAIVSFAVGTTVAKSLFPLVGAEGAVTLRVILSAVVLAVIFRPWKARRTGANLWLTVLFGLVLGAMNLTFYLSLRTLPIGVALGIEFIGPLSVALIGARRLSHVLWVALAAAGLLLLLPIAGGGIDPVGAGFAALAAVFWALYIVLGKKLSDFDPGRSLALGMFAAVLVVAPIGIEPLSVPGVLTPTVLGLGLLVAILSSAIPYSLEMAALRHLPRRTFGVMLSLDPAVGALFGLLLLGEMLTGVQWLAVAFIVAASVGAAATSRDPTPKSAIPTDAPA
ncbi:EamA family transporter [Brevundimonas aveniformis]|uniref:EamA family transporter n=2 Tax=Brevundimonas aveniformis TaxID=370977 RepID=UPI0004270C42|nr:EamA family transporter [Brevundimonas aveniformis]